MSYPLVASEEGIFARMVMVMGEAPQYAEISPYIRMNFSLLRSHAEELARFHSRVVGTECVTLVQIYEALLMTGELSEKEADSLRRLEEKTASELRGENLSVVKSKVFEGLDWLEGLEEDFSAQLLAGAAKQASMSVQLSVPAKIGALLGGPILMPYVEWVLQRSESLGIKRLYFIARDGYMLKCMADVLIKHLQLDIETHYIHGSRKAWRMPSYLGMEGELRGLVGWSHTQHIHTVEDLADVLHVPASTIRLHLLEEYAEEGRQLSFHELSHCVFMLDKSAAFRENLKENLYDKRRLAVEYLKQEIDVSDDDFAFVELGGGGFTQICLSKLMKEFYSGKVRTFFYKMDRVRRPDEHCVFYNFFPSKLKNDLVIEMVCRAAEGQTEGYRHEGEKIVPVKKAGERELYLKAGYADYLKGVEAFTEAYKEAKKKYNPMPCLKASLACMHYLGNAADDEITNFFAGLPNSVTGREKDVPIFAPPLTKKQVQDIYVRYADGMIGAHYAGTDFDMSLKRSTPYIQGLVKKYQKEGWKIRNRWLRMYPEKRMEGGGNLSYPFSLLGKRVVLYGAGKRGRKWYSALSADKAIEVVQWLDKDYLTLKDELPVNGDMDSLGQVEFDWLMVDFADEKLLALVIEELQQHGVVKEKIYYPARITRWISEWINYLRV